MTESSFVESWKVIESDSMFLLIKNSVLTFFDPNLIFFQINSDRLEICSCNSNFVIRVIYSNYCILLKNLK